MKRWLVGVTALVLALGWPACGVAKATPVSAAGATGHCTRWHMHTVASGLGILESLLPDGHGGMLLSSSSHNAVERLQRSGKVTTIASVSSPGQLVRVRHRILFPTGDDAADGLQDKANGTLKLLTLKTRKLTPYAAGLTMPNGLAVAANGDAFVTRDLGSGTGITRIRATAKHHVTTDWATLSDTNGIAIDRKRKLMYVDRTFTKNAPIVEIPMAHPHQAKQIGDLATLGSPTPKGLDDLIMGPHGVLYLPANSGGEIFSFNPRTRHGCLVATGLQDPSAIAFGTGHGWRRGAMFVCGFDGTVRELVPSAGR